MHTQDFGRNSDWTLKKHFRYIIGHSLYWPVTISLKYTIYLDFSFPLGEFKTLLWFASWGSNLESEVWMILTAWWTKSYCCIWHIMDCSFYFLLCACKFLVRFAALSSTLGDLLITTMFHSLQKICWKTVLKVFPCSDQKSVGKGGR